MNTGHRPGIYNGIGFCGLTNTSCSQRITEKQRTRDRSAESHVNALNLTRINVHPLITAIRGSAPTREPHLCEHNSRASHNTQPWRLTLKEIASAMDSMGTESELTKHYTPRASGMMWRISIGWVQVTTSVTEFAGYVTTTRDGSDQSLCAAPRNSRFHHVCQPSLAHNLHLLDRYGLVENWQEILTVLYDSPRISSWMWINICYSFHLEVDAVTYFHEVNMDYTTVIDKYPATTTYEW